MSKPKPARGTNGRFLSGNSGGGRPRGSRNKLSEAFLEALCLDFQAHGAEVIERVRQEEPAAYLRTIAAVMPKRVEVDAVDDLRDLSDGQLVAMIRTCAERDGIEVPQDEAATAH